MASFAQQVVDFLESSKANLETEGHAIAENVEERLENLKPLIGRDAKAAEAEALAFARELFVGNDE